jgi:hypothetical protein
MGSGVYTLEQTAQAGWTAIEHDLHNALAADAWTARPEQAAAAPAVQLVAAEVDGGQARVEAVVTQTLPSGEAVAYQTTGFYRERAAGWVRTAPSAEQLGPLQTRTTTYFVIRYYALDTAVVQAVAPRLDALYRQACANFGLALPAQAQPIRVELSMDPHQSLGWHWTSGGELIDVPSPRLLQLPAAQPAREWVYQALADAVVTAVLQHAAPQVRAGAGVRGDRWGRLKEALRLWQLWQTGGALARQRTEVIRHFYRAASPAHAFTVCRAPSLWQTAASLAARLCRELAQAASSGTETGALYAPPRRLVEQLRMDENKRGSQAQWGEIVALETLVEYAVARYGVERLPALLQATGRYTSWDGLLAAVYGVSAAEFEQGWQAYVAEHYGPWSTKEARDA